MIKNCILPDKNLKIIEYLLLELLLSKVSLEHISWVINIYNIKSVLCN
jgi:hypothetical protein